MKKLILICLLFPAIHVLAQQDDTLYDPAESPPREPPYTMEEDLPTAELPPPTSTYQEPEVIDPLQEQSEFRPGSAELDQIDYTSKKDVFVEGLEAKTSDGTYLYRLDVKSGKRRSGNLRFGIMSPPAISTLIESDLGAYELTYEEMYSSNSVPIIIYDYEWAPFESWNNLRAQIGIGGFFTQGNGRFATPVTDADGEETFVAREKFTFIGLPASLGVVLRFQIGNSWFVPFVNGGGTYTGLIETRDDGQKTNILGTPSFYGGGGLMLNLSKIDRDTGYIFDRDYSISNLWLNFEGRLVQSFSQELDVSSNIFFIGLVADY